MNAQSRRWVVLLAALSVSACGRTSADRPAATPPPDHGMAAAGGELPHGHPPIASTRAADAVFGTVSLAPALRDKAREGQALFLIARAGKDRRIVAVRREDPQEFPRPFEIAPTDAMSEASSFEGPLEITARLSRTGDAAPAPGDLEGSASGVTPGARDVRIELGTVRR